jgi:hypothetical protein
MSFSVRFPRLRLLDADERASADLREWQARREARKCDEHDAARIREAAARRARADVVPFRKGAPAPTPAPPSPPPLRPAASDDVRKLVVADSPQRPGDLLRSLIR